MGDCAFGGAYVPSLLRKGAIIARYKNESKNYQRSFLITDQSSR